MGWRVSESMLSDGIQPVGSVHQYDDGLSVRVDDIVPYELVDDDDSYGYRQGDDLIRCTLYLSNGTGRPVDVGGIGLSVRGGPYGKSARQVHDHQTETLDDELDGTLRTGRRASATWAYSIPAGTAGELDFEVRFEDERESVTFTTACPPRPVDPRVPAARTAPAPLPDQAVLFGDDQRSLFDATEPAAGPGPDVSGDYVARWSTPAAASVLSAQEAGADETDAARVRQIFRFLAEAEESKARPVRTLDGAAGAVWFDELPDDPGVAVMTDGPLQADDQAWLTVARPEREDAPQPKPLLAPWVDEARIRDFKQSRAPHLRQRIEPRFPDWSEGTPLEKTYHELEAHPKREKIEKLYAEWEQEWTGWAERRRAIDPLVKLYDRLHKMHEDAANLGEAYELVLGFGRLTWQTTGGQRVERHLVTHRATVQLDPSTGTLTASPDPTGVGMELEEGMLDGAQHVPGPVREEITGLLEGASDGTDPQQLEVLHTALRSWVNAAHSAGSYVPSLERARPRALDVPHVGLAPALVLRERNRRSTLDALKAIARQIDGGTPPTELLGYIAGRGGALTAAGFAAAQEDGAGGGKRRDVLRASGQRGAADHRGAAAGQSARRRPGTARYRQDAHHRQSGDRSARAGEARPDHQPHPARPAGTEGQTARVRAGPVREPHRGRSRRTA
ncbi:hypothetical protein GCM10020227_16770 [Streptomyces flavovirens]